MTSFFALRLTGCIDSAAHCVPRAACRVPRAALGCDFFLLTKMRRRRIGAYYSPSALTLTKDAIKEKIKGSSFSSPVPTKSQASLARQNSRLSSYSEMPNGAFNSYYEEEDQEEAPNACAAFSRQRELQLAMDDEIRQLDDLEADSHDRYYDLLESVDRETIAPIKQEWIYNVCGMANVDSFPAIPKYLVDEMVDDMLSEMNEIYYQCVQKSVGEYILKNEDERKRFSVSVTPHESALQRRIEFDFGECMRAGLNVPPKSWTRSVQFARDIMTNRLFAFNCCALELQGTWQHYENSLLLDVRLDGSHRTLELDRYKVAQLEHSEGIRNTLRKKWYPSVVETFLSPPQDEALGELILAKEQVFKSVSVLMTRHLRGLVETTCSSLAEFYEQFKTIDPAHVNLAAQVCACLCVREKEIERESARERLYAHIRSKYALGRTFVAVA